MTAVKIATVNTRKIVVHLGKYIISSWDCARELTFPTAGLPPAPEGAPILIDFQPTN